MWTCRAQRWENRLGKLVRNFGHKTRSFLVPVPYEENWYARLQAEVLLDCDERGEIPVTDEEREQLLRICSAPNDDDELWLKRFDERSAALAAATTFTNEELCACAEREVERRLVAYPLRVAAKLLTEKEARRELVVVQT
jgi:hypothetical protein